VTATAACDPPASPPASPAANPLVGRLGRGVAWSALDVLVRRAGGQAPAGMIVSGDGSTGMTGQAQVAAVIVTDNSVDVRAHPARATPPGLLAPFRPSAWSCGRRTAPDGRRRRRDLDRGHQRADPRRHARTRARSSAHAREIIARAGFQPLAVLARDGTGQAGGLRRGARELNWAERLVSLVWVAAGLRGGGIGALLAAAEDEGRARGRTRAHLDTFSYQARPFYEKHGWRVFATLDDNPKGHQRLFPRIPAQGQ
jgi:GNAT superfamily N-acetyltransferase